MFFNQFPYTDFHELNADWIIAHFKEFVEFIRQSNEWMTKHQKEYEQLEQAWDDFVKGSWTPELLATMNKWAADNLENIIGELMIKSVFFEITDSGNFIAYIPESWEEITFNTTEYDYHTPLQTQYGHLVLSY